MSVSGDQNVRLGETVSKNRHRRTRCGKQGNQKHYVRSCVASVVLGLRESCRSVRSSPDVHCTGKRHESGANVHDVQLLPDRSAHDHAVLSAGSSTGRRDFRVH